MKMQENSEKQEQAIPSQTRLNGKIKRIEEAKRWMRRKKAKIIKFYPFCYLAKLDVSRLRAILYVSFQHQ